MNLLPKRFRVQNHRNIHDSGWLAIDSLTAFVGRNESGKTTLLDALHKFNSATGLTYDADQDPPRDAATNHYDLTKPWPVCAVDFKVSEAFALTIEENVGALVEVPPSALFTRYSDHSLKIEYGQTTDIVTTRPPTTTMVLARLQEQLAPAVRATGHDLTKDPYLTSFAALHHSISDYSIDVSLPLTPDSFEVIQHWWDNTRDMFEPTGVASTETYLTALAEQLDDPYDPLAIDPLTHILFSNLPVCHYFEDYTNVPGIVDIRQYMTAKDHTPEDNKILATSAIFAVSGLEPTTLVQPDNQDIQTKMPQSRQLRNVASRRVSNEFTKAYKQRKHTFHFEESPTRFDVFVTDDAHPNVETNLDERSHGFRSFFSLYLTLKAASTERHAGAIVLLDEPGLHLHPTAQQDLVMFLQELSETETILYTTHSPFMLSEHRLDSVHAVVDYADGRIEVHQGTWPTDQDAIFPLRALTGYKLLSDMISRVKTVLVEGYADYWYLKGLSRLCRLSNRSCLLDNTYIVPGRGAPSLRPIASLFCAEDVWPVIVLDSDDSGDGQRRSLGSDLYKEHTGRIISLGDILSMSECEIEDLVGADVILPVLERAFGRSIGPDELDTSVQTLVGQIEAAAKKKTISLPKKNEWKPLVARQISDGWGQIGGDEVPPELDDVLNRAASLFEKIEEAFEKPAETEAGA